MFDDCCILLCAGLVKHMCIHVYLWQSSLGIHQCPKFVSLLSYPKGNQSYGRNCVSAFFEHKAIAIYLCVNEIEPRITT